MMNLCDDCGGFIEAEIIEPDSLDEIADLMAEAARASTHAARAYGLLADQFGLEPLKARQWLIEGRMKEVA